MIYGDPERFAIESEITMPFAEAGKLALGYFVIHIAGSTYGVKSPQATLLACSFDEVERLLAERGEKNVAFARGESCWAIADAVSACLYDEDRQSETFFGMTAEALRDFLAAQDILWAPDGDQAFDDGGHVLKIEDGKTVRLVGFVNRRAVDGGVYKVSEYAVESDVFYSILESWRSSFQEARDLALKSSKKN